MQQATYARIPLLFNHIRIVQQIKERFSVRPHATLPKNRKDETTTTKAYIDAVNADKLFETWSPAAYYKDELKRLKEDYERLVTLALKREKQHADDYYVFYHGQKKEFFVLQDFIKEVYALLKLNACYKEFQFLRAWYEAEPSFKVSEFIDKEEVDLVVMQKLFALHKLKSPSGSLESVWLKAWQEAQSKMNPDRVISQEEKDLMAQLHRSKQWWDHRDDLVKNMICVNLSLFGNLSSPGESSFRYFTSNSNINFLKLEELIKRVLNKFNFDESYVNELVDLLNLIQTNEGSLLQIFIPKNKVDEYVYLSHAFGTPYRNEIDKHSFDPTKERHLKISSILDMYANNVSAIKDFDCLQARILLSQDCMLNPQSGVKIFRYHTVDKAKIKEYKKRLRVLINRMFKDWFDKGQYKTILGDQQIIDSPFGTLLRLMQNSAK